MYVHFDIEAAVLYTFEYHYGVHGRVTHLSCIPDCSEPTFIRSWQYNKVTHNKPISSDLLGEIYLFYWEGGICLCWPVCNIFWSPPCEHKQFCPLCLQGKSCSSLAPLLTNNFYPPFDHERIPVPPLTQWKKYDKPSHFSYAIVLAIQKKNN